MVSYLNDAPIKGRIVEGVRARHVKFDNLIADQKLKLLIGTEILGITRKAKYILFKLDNGFLVGHNRFSGFWSLASKPWAFDYLEFDRPAGGAEAKDIRFELHLSGGEVLHYHDARCLGVMKYEQRRNPATIPYLAHMGPDVVHTSNLDPSFATSWSTSDLIRAAKETQSPVKSLLLDQKVQAGIGNIYACEAMWKAKVNPFAPANSLAEPKLESLHKAVIDLMSTALSHSVDYDKYIQVFRAKICPDCKTAIKREEQQNRGTYMCPQCQS